jgi:hypothetical protein
MTSPRPTSIDDVAEAIRITHSQGQDPDRWELNFGTVEDPNNADIPNVILDGDTKLIPAISLVGKLTTGDRVSLISVPPSGLYVIGRPRAVSVNANGQVSTGVGNSTNSAAFSNYPSPYSVTFNKMQFNTGLLVRWSPTFFTDNGATGPEFGVQVTAGGTSTDYVTHNLPGTLSINVRLPSFGERLIPNVLAGSVTVTGRWRRFAGAGTIFAVNGNDYASLTVEEV